MSRIRTASNARRLRKPDFLRDIASKAGGARDISGIAILTHAPETRPAHAEPRPKEIKGRSDAQRDGRFDPMEILRDPFFLLRAGHADEKDVRVDALKHFQDAQISFSFSLSQTGGL